MLWLVSEPESWSWGAPQEWDSNLEVQVAVVQRCSPITVALSSTSSVSLEILSNPHDALKQPFTLKQTHSTNLQLITVKKSKQHKNYAITDQIQSDIEEGADGWVVVATPSAIASIPSHLLFGIRTADCLSVAFIFEDTNTIATAIVHAGWKGYVEGVHFKALKAMYSQSAGASSTMGFTEFCENIRAVMSPSIFGVTYPCGEDVRIALERHRAFLYGNCVHFAEFAKMWDLAANVSVAPNMVFSPEKGKIYPDLQLLMSCDLLALGVDSSRILALRENTFWSSYLPSYRRSVTSKGCDSGKRLTSCLVFGERRSCLQW